MRPQALLAAIERHAVRHHAAVFAVAAVLVLLSAWAGGRLRLDAEILSLAPGQNRTIGVFKRSVREFGSLDSFLILLAAPDDGEVGEGGTGAQEYEEFADALAARLEALDGIEYVEYRLDESSPVFSLLSENALLFLGPGALGEVRALFGDASIRSRVARLRERLESEPSFLLGVEARVDPLGLFPLIYDGFVKRRGSFRADLRDGYYLSLDGKALLIAAKPTRPPQDLDFSRELLRDVEMATLEAATAVRARHDPADGDPLAGMSVGYGGGHAIAASDSDLIKADLVWNAVVSFLLVAGLYMFCYRRLAAIAYSSVPLLVGQVLTFAVAWLFLPGLNSATSGFTALLMGLGTDFTIVMYGRYIEERRLGRSLEEAVGRIMGETALGVFTGVITSAGTFYAMCVTEMPGLREFGFLVGTGILLCGASILFLLPAMIAYVEGERVTRIGSVFALLVFPALPIPLLRWWERRRDRRGRPRALYLHSFGVERLMTVAVRRPVPTVILSLGACLALGAFALRLELSESLRDLRSPHNLGVAVQEDVARRFGSSTNAMIVMCRGRSVDEVMERTERAAARIEALAAAGRVQSHESILSYLPPRAAQEEVVRALGIGSPDAFDIDRIERTFREALRENGFRPDAYDAWLAGLRSVLRPARALGVDDLSRRGLGDLVGRYYRIVGDEHVTATYVFPPAGPPDPAGLEASAREIEGGEEGVVATGVVLVGLELRRLFRRDAARAVVLGLLLVGLLLYADFRKGRLVLFALLQLSGGVIAMLGAMSLLGIPMNFVNAFATTMILGVGVDYGIHIIHRFSRAGGSADGGVQDTGKAVVMAALTNIAGFGTIAFSNFPGLRSVGIVCVLGTVGCLLTALTLLPALMTLSERARSRAAPGS